jgi:hypothetical protein
MDVNEVANKIVDDLEEEKKISLSNCTVSVRHRRTKNFKVGITTFEK